MAGTLRRESYRFARRDEIMKLIVTDVLNFDFPENFAAHARKVGSKLQGKLVLRRESPRGACFTGLFAGKCWKAFMQ
jgi:hypothetical protein